VGLIDRFFIFDVCATCPHIAKDFVLDDKSWYNETILLVHMYLHICQTMITCCRTPGQLTARNILAHLIN